MNCYVCDTEINKDNETEEHIILNAAGGRLKSKKLICKQCNSEFGETVDSNLAKQLNSLANMLMVKRHRGEPQSFIAINQTTGKKYIIEVGGKPKLTQPTVNKVTNGTITTISVIARNEKELRQALNGIARNNPDLDVEATMQQAVWKEEYVDEELQFEVTIGGNESFKAVCKCAINFYIYNGGEASQINHLIPYIKGEEEKDVVWMHYEEDLYELKPNESFHILHLVGNPSEGILYCYVDYFNAHKYLVLLSDNYTGETIDSTYCFDLINTTPIQKEIKKRYDRETVINFLKNKNSKPYDQARKSFEHVAKLGLKLQNEKHRDELISMAINKAFDNYPDEPTITEEMMEEAIREVVKNMAPYLARGIKND